MVELPNRERYGFIWAVLSADADIDVDEHLGTVGPDLEAPDYASFGYLLDQVVVLRLKFVD